MAHILVIEGENLVRASLEAVLTAKGHTVALAGNGWQGLEQLKNGDFDLVIADCAIPEMAGAETIRAIRERARNLPILALSGSGRRIVPEITARTGPNVVLQKPFRSIQLLEAVYRAMALRCANRPPRPIDPAPTTVGTQQSR